MKNESSKFPRKIIYISWYFMVCCPYSISIFNLLEDILHLEMFGWPMPPCGPCLHGNGARFVGIELVEDHLWDSGFASIYLYMVMCLFGMMESNRNQGWPPFFRLEKKPNPAILWGFCHDWLQSWNRNKINKPLFGVWFPLLNPSFLVNLTLKSSPASPRLAQSSCDPSCLVPWWKSKGGSFIHSMR